MESETFMDACPECGAQYSEDLKYCAACGVSLNSLAPAPSTPLPAGTIVGSYRLLDLLGEGGMGRVYVAEHVKLGRRVALKMLRPELGSNPVAVARFFAEAQAVNRISNENIVEITDFLDRPGLPTCYIMELLRGEDLGLRLLRLEVLPIAVTVDIGVQIASALTAVHAAGIIHRDLKPDNIFLIDRSGAPNFVKLLDFGVAKLSDTIEHGIAMHTTAIGQVLGTPEYMSPEQAGGQAVDHRTDIYALGVILCEAITGRLPFEAKSFGELIIKQATAPARRPSSYADLPHEIPPALDDLIAELLAKEPDDRPQSMAEIEQRLREIYATLDPSPLPRRVSTGSIRVIARATPAPRGVSNSGAVPVLAASTLPGHSAQIPATARLGWRIAAGFVTVSIALLLAWSIHRNAADAQASPARPGSSPRATGSTSPVVMLRFTSTPSEASVRDLRNGNLLGTTPFVLRIAREDRTMTVEIAKQGYQAAVEDVDLAFDGGLMAALIAAPAIATPPPPAPLLAR